VVAAVVSAVARGDCEVLELCQEDLRRLIADRPELSDRPVIVGGGTLIGDEEERWVPLLPD